jgi:hypothetical protein
MKKNYNNSSGFLGFGSFILFSEKWSRVYYEKNESVGGRARQFKIDGFTLIWDLAGTGCQMF